MQNVAGETPSTTGRLRKLKPIKCGGPGYDGCGVRLRSALIPAVVPQTPDPSRSSASGVLSHTPEASVGCRTITHHSPAKKLTARLRLTGDTVAVSRIISSTLRIGDALITVAFSANNASTDAIKSVAADSDCVAL